MTKIKVNFDVINKETNFFEWHNPTKRFVVFPLKDRLTEDLYDRKLWQIEMLGCKIRGKIAMPLDLGCEFYLAQYPKEFYIKAPDEDDDGTILSFQDKRGRSRFRIICNPIMLNTNIWTRYLPDLYRKDLKEMLPCVKDLEKADEDYEGEDEDAIIWKGKVDGIMHYGDILKVAEKWLDRNYPLWADPTAYWS